MGKHSEDKYSHNKKREKGHNEAGNISVLDLSIGDDQFQFNTNIYDAVTKTENELHSIEEKIHETEESIKKLTPACDKTDYILAATCGALCGVIDVFYVGKPGKSPLGDITDEWFEKCTMCNCQHPLNCSIGKWLTCFPEHGTGWVFLPYMCKIVY